LAFDNLLKYQQQLDPLAQPILNSTTAFCGDKLTRNVGAFVANKYAFAEEFQDAATRRDIGRDLEVLWLVDNPQTPSMGLQVGDKILSVAGRAMPADDDAMDEYRNSLHEQRGNSEPLSIVVLRNGESLSLAVPTRASCDYPVVAVLDLVPNAYADGSLIAINSGLMRFFDNPEDLQVVIGHELAHNTKGHIGKGLTGWALGTIVDIAIGMDESVFGEIGARVFSPTLESEADYVGLYIAANAGVNISEAERIWRAFGTESGGDKDRGILDTHPPSPERFVALRATVKEIETKRVNGEALRPNR